MLVLKDNTVLDLLKFGLNPGVIGVTVGVESSKRLQAQLGLAVIDEPAGRLGEEENEGGEEDGRDDLDAERGPPLPIVGGIKADIGA